MRDILYFVLLFTIFGSYNLFAVEQPKRELNKKNDANALQYKVHNIETKKKLEKDLTELPQNNTADFDNLNLKKSKDKKIGIRKRDKPTVIKLDSLGVEDKEQESRKDSESTVPGLEKTLNNSDKINKIPEEHYKSTVNRLPDLKKTLDEDDEINEISPDLSEDPLVKPIIGGLLKKKDFLDTSLSDTANLQKESKSNQVNKSGSLKNNIDQLLKEKENLSKVESQAKEKNAELLNDTFKSHKQEKPIAETDEEGKQKKLQKWTEVSKKPVKEWIHKDTQEKAIYKRQYDNLNEHLPTTVFIHDYSKQLFYCIKKNDLSCLRGIIGKLEKIGLSVKEILKFRNHLGDTPLIYAVKQGEIDIVRFLLLQGSDLSLVNNDFHSAMDIAIKKKQIDIINAIVEMTPHLIERSRVNNKKDSTMYNWAINTKENDELKCGEK